MADTHALFRPGAQRDSLYSLAGLMAPQTVDLVTLSPVGHPTINLQGRYRNTGRASTGWLRPRRRAEQLG